MSIRSKDLVSIESLEQEEIDEIFSLTADIKRAKSRYRNALGGKIVALIFEKPSLRTRFTFEAGIYELGGKGIYLGQDEIGLGKRESIHDVARNIERWSHGVVIRTFSHGNVTSFAAACSVPVINGLDDLFHPCQALTDLFTLQEHKHSLKGLTVAWVGDGNNVLHSLLWGSVKMGVNIRIAVPKGYEPDPGITKKVLEIASARKVDVLITNSAREAVQGADAVYTDVWTSMGRESEAGERRKAFSQFRVDRSLMRMAKPEALFMHCLPAHRGEEATDEVIDAPYSIVFDQAENRLHLQKALLILLLGKEGTDDSK
jgi:ornithine carbamoyltransferase